MSIYEFRVGYGRGEIEPKIAPLVDAVTKARFITFSSCEGHIDDLANDQVRTRFASVAFYAHEDEARLVHEFFLGYRDRLACSWCFTGGFVARRKTDLWALGWTLESCGIIERVAAPDFETGTVEAGWNVDIPMLVKMFGDIRSRRTAS